MRKNPCWYECSGSGSRESPAISKLAAVWNGHLARFATRWKPVLHPVLGSKRTSRIYGRVSNTGLNQKQRLQIVLQGLPLNGIKG